MKTVEAHAHQNGSETTSGTAMAGLELTPTSRESADLPLLGMHCSACAVRIEKALNKAPGVETANVNFATTRATVSFDPAQTDLHQLRAAVQKPDTTPSCWTRRKWKKRA